MLRKAASLAVGDPRKDPTLSILIDVASPTYYRLRAIEAIKMGGFQNLVLAVSILLICICHENEAESAI